MGNTSTLCAIVGKDFARSGEGEGQGGVREDKKEGEKKHVKTRDDVMKNLRSIRRSLPLFGQKEKMPVERQE